MRAIVVHQTGGPESLKCEDVPVPKFGPNDVLIKVAACGVCFHDVVVRNGVMKYHVELPLIPGHEISGIIDQVGSNVSGFSVGDRVATTAQRMTCGRCVECRKGQENRCIDKLVLGDAGLNGGYAEYVAVDARSIANVPQDVSLDTASIVGCAICTELNAIRDVAQGRAGESVLITGAGGGVGIHAVQVARAMGMYVIAATTSEAKTEAIRNAGANEVLVIRRSEDFSGRVKMLTGGLGADVVIDNVGTVLFNPTRRSVAFGGRWVMVGQLTGDFVPFNPAQLFLRHVSLLSGNGSVKRQLDDALRMIQLGTVKPVVQQVFALDEADRAHEMLQSGEVIGRLLLKPSP
jgi:acryloyl-coenzyme A reductase